MNQEDKEERSFLVASGQATPDQEAELKLLIDSDPQLARLHRLDRADIRALKSVAQRSEAPLPTPELTEKIILQLHREVQADGQKSPLNPVISLFGWASALAACIAIVLFASRFLNPSDELPPIVTLAPTGQIGSLAPSIIWENRENQKYDVWILPEEGDKDKVEALFATKGVRSPITFSDLKPTQPDHQLRTGEDYRVLICYAGKGRIGGTAFPFQISGDANSNLPSPKNPAEATLTVTDLLERDLPADALMVIEALPKDIRLLPELEELAGEARRRILEANQNGQ